MTLLFEVAGCGSNPENVKSLPTIFVSGPSSVRVGSTSQFTANVTGLSTPTVTWSVASASGGSAVSLGSIAPSGVYTPPATASAVTVTIVATSTVDPSLTSSTPVQLLNPVPQISSAFITASSSSTFTVSVAGSNFVAGTTLSVGSNIVTPTSVSSTALTATMSMAVTQPSQVTVQVNNPNPGAVVSNTVTVSVQPFPTISVSGPSSVRIGSTGQFSAKVAGLSTTTANWSVASASPGSTASLGSISASGVYTPPTTPSAGTVMIVATSAADPSLTASTSVQLLNPVPQISSASITATSSSTVAVSVVGSNFVAGSTLAVEANVVTPTTVTSTKLTATVSMAVTQASQVTVQIRNPNPGAIVSNTVTVSVEPFPTMSVSGPSSVRVGATGQFAAEITGLSTPTVNWSVASASLGSTSSLGSISTSGVYTPPATTSAGTVMIVATSTADPSLTSSTTVQLLNPVPQISSASITPTSNFTFIVSVAGSNFVAGSTLAVGSTTVTPTSVSSTTLTATVSMAALQTSQATVQANNPDPGADVSNIVTVPVQQGLATITAATRLLDQASFGPTFSSIAQVQAEGLNAYLTEQFSEPPSVMPGISDNGATWPKGCYPSAACISDGYWAQFAVFGQDQLRQRVAFALSKIWTVSYYSTSPLYFPELLDSFSTDAFSNWRTIMEDVTLSPAMGNYLNMVNNMIQSPADRANENYGRELMQVFDLGTSRLNLDGTYQLDSNGNQIPIYTQDQVDAFARAFTGWTYANDDCSTPRTPQTADPTYLPGSMCPMVALNQYHDEGSKTLLNGTTLPASQTAKQDLEGALDNVFNDPDLPPFVSSLLIQNLIESQPSPDYVKRVASVFIDNGSGVRGDMQAVIKAILLDPEARAGDDPSVSGAGGHLRDPISEWLAMLRAVNATQTGDMSAFGPLNVYCIGSEGEHPHEASNVFGFYSPTYLIPGTQIVGPEFELETGPNVMNDATCIEQLLIYGNWGVSSTGASIQVDTSSAGQLGVLAAQGVDPFIDGLNILFFHGNMTSQTRAAFVKALSNLGTAQMVRVGVYLTFFSPEFRVSQ